MEQGPGAAQRRWKGQVEDLMMYSSYQDAVGIDGEAIEFEWKFSQNFRHCLFLKKSTKTWRRRTSNQRTSRTGSFSCQCSVTFCGNQMIRIASRCISNADKVKNYPMKFLPGHWTLLGSGSEKRWYGDSHDQQGMEYLETSCWCGLKEFNSTCLLDERVPWSSSRELLLWYSVWGNYSVFSHAHVVCVGTPTQVWCCRQFLQSCVQFSSCVTVVHTLDPLHQHWLMMTRLAWLKSDL